MGNSVHSKLAKHPDFIQESFNGNIKDLKQVKVGTGYVEYVTQITPNAQMKALGAEIQYDRVWIQCSSGATFRAKKRGINYTFKG